MVSLLILFISGFLWGFFDLIRKLCLEFLSITHVVYIILLSQLIIFFFGLYYSTLTITNSNYYIFLGLISLAISMLLIFWLTKSCKTYEKFTLSLILGGALGNGIDRIYQSYVIDFIDFHYKGYHWPAFNVADTFITIGVIIYIIYNLNEALFLKK